MYHSLVKNRKTQIRTYYMVTKDHMAMHTVNEERFAGLNFHGFYPMKFLWENFHNAVHKFTKLV